MEQDFEAWEGHYELEEQGDYTGLVELCKREVAQNPEDLYAVERLGYAYIKAERFLEAIGAVEPYHRRHPDIDTFHHVILDALFAMDLTEEDFKWSRQPVILRLGPEVADWFFQYLRPKRKPRSAFYLHAQLVMSGYLTFDAEELMNFLRRDNRFTVGGDDWTSSNIRTA